MIDRPYADWTDEKLCEYEEQLYDDGIHGDDSAWFIRDQILWELNYRETCFVKRALGS